MSESFRISVNSTELLNLLERTKDHLERHGDLVIEEGDSIMGWHGDLPIFSRFPSMQYAIGSEALSSALPDEAKDLALGEQLHIAYFLPHYVHLTDEREIVTRHPAVGFLLDKKANQAKVDSETLFIERDVVSNQWASSRYAYNAAGEEVLDYAPSHMTKPEHWALLEIVGAIGTQL
jgi:hypothetical protein